MDIDQLASITEFEYENGLQVSQERFNLPDQFVTRALLSYANGYLSSIESCYFQNCDSSEIQNLIYNTQGNLIEREILNKLSVSETRILSLENFEYDNFKTPYADSNMSELVYVSNSGIYLIPSLNNILETNITSYNSNGSVREVFNQTYVHTYNKNEQPIITTLFQGDTFVSEYSYEYY